MKKPVKIISLIGPTASGKTELSMMIAREFSCEIVCIDSLNLYKGFDIGTAKPTLVEREQTTHHLIDVLNPQEAITVVDFVDLAEQAIKTVLSKNLIPLLVVGSPLYYYSLTKRSFSPPPTAENLRIALKERANIEGMETLYKELSRVDLLSAQKIKPSDGRRIIRYLEVFYLTGKPYSSFNQNFFQADDKFQQIKVGLNPDRAFLKTKILLRTKQMIEIGLIGETKSLIDSGISTNVPAFSSIGYQEARLFLENKISLEELIDLISKRTNRYAKHQLTWFKRDKNIIWYNYHSLESFQQIKNLILQHIKDNND